VQKDVQGTEKQTSGYIRISGLCSADLEVDHQGSGDTGVGGVGNQSEHVVDCEEVAPLVQGLQDEVVNALGMHAPVLHSSGKGNHHSGGHVSQSKAGAHQVLHGMQHVAPGRQGLVAGVHKNLAKLHTGRTKWIAGPGHPLVCGVAKLGKAGKGGWGTNLGACHGVRNVLEVPGKVLLKARRRIVDNRMGIEAELGGLTVGVNVEIAAGEFSADAGRIKLGVVLLAEGCRVKDFELVVKIVGVGTPSGDAGVGRGMAAVLLHEGGNVDKVHG